MGSGLPSVVRLLRPLSLAGVVIVALLVGAWWWVRHQPSPSVAPSASTARFLFPVPSRRSSWPATTASCSGSSTSRTSRSPRRPDRVRRVHPPGSDGARGVGRRTLVWGIQDVRGVYVTNVKLPNAGPYTAASRRGSGQGGQDVDVRLDVLDKAAGVASGTRRRRPGRPPRGRRRRRREISSTRRPCSASTRPRSPKRSRRTPIRAGLRHARILPERAVADARSCQERLRQVPGPHGHQRRALSARDEGRQPPAGNAGTAAARSGAVSARLGVPARPGFRRGGEVSSTARRGIIAEELKASIDQVVKG